MCNQPTQIFRRVTTDLLLLTVVQSDEKYPLDHVIDIELFTQLLPRPERATDLCHRVIVLIDAVRHRVLRLGLAFPRVFHCGEGIKMTILIITK